MSNNEPIDLDLVDKVYALIPGHTRQDVCDALITNMVDNMPSNVLDKLTGDPQGFDQAESILHSYYEETSDFKELLIDCFKIFGDENTLYLLDSMQLDKRPNPQEINVSSGTCEVSELQGEPSQDN